AVEATGAVIQQKYKAVAAAFVDGDGGRVDDGEVGVAVAVEVADGDAEGHAAGGGAGFFEVAAALVEKDADVVAVEVGRDEVGAFVAIEVGGAEALVRVV